MCVLAFGNWSVGGRVGRSIPLSPFSPDLTSFMRPLCLVTMVTERQWVQKTAKSGFQCRYFENWGEIRLFYRSDWNLSVVLWYVCVPCLSHCGWWCDYLAADQIFSLKWSLRFLLTQLCLTCFQPPILSFDLSTLYYFSNIWAERVSGPSEGRCHQSNEDCHHKW